MTRPNKQQKKEYKTTYQTIDLATRTPPRMKRRNRDYWIWFLTELSTDCRIYEYEIIEIHLKLARFYCNTNYNKHVSLVNIFLNNTLETFSMLRIQKKIYNI